MTQSAPTAKRQPKGWDKLVSQLNEVTDRRQFLRNMLDVQCKVVSAEYGGLWVQGDDGQPKLIEAWPDQLTKAREGSAVINLMSEAAKSGLDKGVSHVLKLEPHTTGPEADINAHVFVTPLRAGGQVAAVCTTVAETPDENAVQHTAALRELAAGLYEGFEAKQQTQQFRSDAERVRKSLAALGVVQEAAGFHGACLNLCNELARQLKCQRVSVGWVKGNDIKLVAMSDTEDLKRHSEDARLLELAMAESLDQQQPVVYPVPDDAEDLLKQAVLHAHRKVTGEHPNQHVLSIPLREGDEWIGAITVERSEQPFDPFSIQQIQLVVDVVAPFLADRKRGSQWLHTHLWRDIEWGAKYLVGPKHIGWKLLGVGIALLLAVFIFSTWPYSVGSDFRLEADARRVVPAPYDGQLKVVHVEPGDDVDQGELLAELDATELKLQLVEAQSQLNTARLEKSKATAEGKTAEAHQAQAQIDRQQARIDLLQFRIDNAKITAPIDGKVLSGAWRDKIGGVVETGEELFQIAPLSDIVAVLRVDERDIEFIDLGQTGSLATRSRPEQPMDYEIYQVVPLANPVEGVNVFEVRARIEDPREWLRPGMEGVASTEVGPRRLVWIATHEIADTIRLWLWYF